MAVVVAFLLLSLAATSLGQTVDPYLPMMEPANPLADIQVACDLQRRLISVTADFEGGFRGYLYAKGFYDAQECRTLGSGRRSMTLVLPLDGCGTSTNDIRSEATPQYFNNTVVIMNEAEWGLLGMMDSTYTVSCRIGGSSVQRFDYGFTVPMLTTAGSLVITSSPATCSMRVVTGQDPRARPTTLLFLGDIASLVFVLDDNRQYDMFVSDCRVSDGTSRDMLTLIDSDGCPAHRKLIGFTNYNTAMVRGQTYAYAHFKVFKFPDRDNVFVQCKCHVCLDSCNRPACETGASIGNSKVFRKKRDMGVNDVIVDYDAGEPQIVSDKKNTTVDLYRQITIAIPNKQHIESSHLESSSETGRLPDLEPPIRANSPQRLRTCNSHSRILVIVVIALALLLLLFMTLTALFFHKSRHQTARQSDQMTTSSMYSNTKLVPIR